MFAGGSFGRRAHARPPTSRRSSADVAKAAGGDGAWKLMWTREDDIRGGRYRPLTAHRLRAGLDGEGNITAWDNVRRQPVDHDRHAVRGDDGEGRASTRPPSRGRTSCPTHSPPAGSAGSGWRARCRCCGGARSATPIPATRWRPSWTACSAQPARIRWKGASRLMKDDRPRDRGVLERVAEMAEWSGPGTGDRRMGVAVCAASAATSPRSPRSRTGAACRRSPASGAPSIAASP